MTDDGKFLRDFEACRWTLERWHHRDHIKLAYLYLCRHPPDEAIAKVRAGIRAHNAAHQIPETPTRGYHETVTQAWLRLVHAAINEAGQAETADAFCDRHPELSQMDTLRLYYSPERLASAEAKASFVQPDLSPLPEKHAP